MKKALLVKAHVKGYTRSDGVYVQQHEDKRTRNLNSPSGKHLHDFVSTVHGGDISKVAPGLLADDVARYKSRRAEGAAKKPATMATRFAAKAKELLPHLPELQELDLALDSADKIDDAMFSKGEYLGGMAAVILALVKKG